MVVANQEDRRNKNESYFIKRCKKVRKKGKLKM